MKFACCVPLELHMQYSHNYSHISFFAILDLKPDLIALTLKPENSKFLKKISILFAKSTKSLKTNAR